MILQIAELEFAYNGHPVLRDVRLEVRAGELLAILGPNGVGKTTLLKCINAIHRPRGGVVRVDGQDILRLAPAEISRSVGYVAQRCEPARLTVFDAVLMGRKPHIRWKPSEKDLSIVDAAIRRLHLKALLLRHIDTLSGGELQKVAIARALVQEPRLLLLDEPTSSLDLKNQMDILTLVRRVVDEHAIAAVMTMHDLNTALRFAHKFLFLKDGKIFSTGLSRDISADMVGQVYGLPVEIHLINGHPTVTPILEPQSDHDHDHHHVHACVESPHADCTRHNHP
ncbi:MAG: ABC transporter ATP-binding protein [Deltaproteobacteria bacterium]|nr:ABC transporter ATP-binding protein [Deltaproteobacteria bacterium]